LLTDRPYTAFAAQPILIEDTYHCWAVDVPCDEALMTKPPSYSGHDRPVRATNATIS
jgi:hypothetical protein